MGEKVRLQVYIPASLNEELRRFLVEQYGSYHHGLLSFEVCQAIQSWIGTHKSTQMQFVRKTVNPIPNVFLIKEQVREWLKERFGYDHVYKVPKKQLILAISALRGTDPRTVRKWIKLFERYKLIKWITPNVVEIP